MAAAARAGWDSREKVIAIRAQVDDILGADAELADWCDEACLRRYLRARDITWLLHCFRSLGLLVKVYKYVYIRKKPDEQ